VTTKTQQPTVYSVTAESGFDDEEDIILCEMGKESFSLFSEDGQVLDISYKELPHLKRVIERVEELLAGRGGSQSCAL
jgi:hypothetical protein